MTDQPKTAAEPLPPGPLPAEVEQRERLISKEQEGLVETVHEPEGAKKPVKEGHLTKALIFAVISCAFGSSFQFGYHIGCVNIPGELIQNWIKQNHRDLTGDEKTQEQMNALWGFIVGMFAIGGMFGGVLVGLVADKLGRRQALLYNNFFAVVAAIIMTSAKYIGVYWLLALGRFIIGFNAGLNSGLAPMYLTEISPANLRGAIGSVAQLFVTISIMVSQIIGLPFLLGTEERWPWIFAFTIIPVVFQLITLPFCPESPKFNLIVKGRKEQAERDLKKLRGEDDVSAELDQIDEEAETARSQPKVGMKAMFKEPLLWPLILAMFMMLSQQLSGINAVMFYSTDIFKKAGLDKDAANYATIGMGAINVLMTIVSVYMVDRLGRRTLHLAGMGGMVVTSALVAVTMIVMNNIDNVKWVSYFSIVFVLLFVVSFATGPGSIPWFYVSEVFPSNARGNANSIAVLTNWGTNAIVGFGFPPLEGLVNEYVFFAFTAFLVLFILFALKYLPETKNKTLEQIQLEMDRRRGVKGRRHELAASS